MTTQERERQRLDALAYANEIRIKRAQLKRDIKSGRCSIQSVLTDPPPYVETAKVFDMLRAMPKYWTARTNKVLAQCRISPSKTIGGLSQRQRDKLASLLRGPVHVVAPSARLTRRDMPAPSLSRLRVIHMTTRVIADMHDSACGKVLAPHNATTDAMRVTCRHCQLVMAANRAPSPTA